MVIYLVVSAIQCLNNWGQKVIGLNPIVISWIVSSKLPVTEKKKHLCHVFTRLKIQISNNIEVRNMRPFTTVKI